MRRVPATLLIKGGVILVLTVVLIAMFLAGQDRGEYWETLPPPPAPPQAGQPSFTPVVLATTEAR